MNLRLFTSYYACRTQEDVVSLLSFLKGSISLVVTDKEGDFSKSVTQNKELKSTLIYLWEAHLH